MMKKLIFFFVAISALSSCLKEPIENSQISGDSQTITIEAVSSQESSPKDTKTTLVDHSLVHWTNGDQIKIGFFPTTNGSRNTLNNKNGIFTSTFTESTASSAYFKIDAWSWDAGNSEKESDYRADGLAVYPSSATVYSKRTEKWGPAETEVSYNLPNEQLAVLNSFQSGVNFSYARVNKSDFSANQATLSFLNACALLKISIPSTATDIATIEVSSKTDVPLTGKFGLGYDDLGGYDQDNPWGASENGLLNFTAISGNSKVLLSAESGSALVAGGTYYLVVWPGTHSSGLSFEFTNLEGDTCVKEVAKSVTFERAGIKSYNFVSEITFTKKPSLEVTPISFTAIAAGETLSFNVNANSNWTVTEDADWISVSPSSGAAGNATVNVTFAENMTASARTATIKVTHAEGLERTISVSQETGAYTYKITGGYLTYASDLTNGLYVITNKYFPDHFWTEESGKLTTTGQTTSSTFLAQHVFEYISNSSYLNGNIHNNSSFNKPNGNLNYYSWSAGVWKSVSTGLYLDESFNLTAQELDACCFQYANNWGGSEGGELKGIDVYKNPLEESTRQTLWYNGSKFEFGDMNLYYINGNVDRRKYYIYKVEKQ